jgi:hypothetical protein
MGRSGTGQFQLRGLWFSEADAFIFLRHVELTEDFFGQVPMLRMFSARFAKAPLEIADGAVHIKIEDDQMQIRVMRLTCREGIVSGQLEFNEGKLVKAEGTVRPSKAFWAGVAPRNGYLESYLGSRSFSRLYFIYHDGRFTLRSPSGPLFEARWNPGV